jgi:hypothetical protein
VSAPASGERRRAVRYRPRDARVEILGRSVGLTDLSVMGMHTNALWEDLAPGSIVSLILRLPRANPTRPPHRFELAAIVVGQSATGTALRYLQPSKRWVRALEAYLAADSDAGAD